MIGNDTHAYKRRLPHLSKAGKTYFVTFVTADRWPLPPLARDLVLRACLHGHGRQHWLHCCVVMPDHAHLLLEPYDDSSVRRIIGDIKSVSAHRINRAMQRRGSVWQEESFDTSCARTRT